ncbi:MAG: MAPEG family protein [Pseudolabrys sp.]|nr:MAPEG family protein [Pseudolabrys sp.]
MPLTITALYAAILALIIVALGINVTVHRMKLKVSLGDGGNPVMLRVIRMHANAVEYLPLALVLMALYELNGGLRWPLHAVGIALITGRIIQSWAMLSDSPMPKSGRGIGQLLTWGSLVALALLNLAKVI